MNIILHLRNESLPILLDNIKNTYQKGKMYCVLLLDGSIHKFPIDHIFRVIEYQKEEK